MMSLLLLLCLSMLWRILKCMEILKVISICSQCMYQLYILIWIINLSFFPFLFSLDESIIIALLARLIIPVCSLPSINASLLTLDHSQLCQDPWPTQSKMQIQTDAQEETPSSKENLSSVPSQATSVSVRGVSSCSCLVLFPFVLFCRIGSLTTLWLLWLIRFKVLNTKLTSLWNPNTRSKVSSAPTSSSWTKEMFWYSYTITILLPLLIHRLIYYVGDDQNTHIEITILGQTHLSLRAITQ